MQVIDIKAKTMKYVDSFIPENLFFFQFRIYKVYFKFIATIEMIV